MNHMIDTQKLKSQITEKEWQLRLDLAATYRLIAMYGWDDLIYTHVSLRIPGPEHHFLINPYGLMFDEITASSLVKIDLNGDSVIDTPYEVNPAGFTIHSAIHSAREDAQCVLHLHTNDGVAVSIQKDGLLPISQTSMLIHPHIAYHDYEGLALDHSEKERLIKDIGDKNLFILRNHGTLSVGQTCGIAFMGIYFLERACSAQIRAQAAGKINLPSKEAIKTTQKQSVGMFDLGKDRLAWPALLRKLERHSPNYKI